MIAYFGLALDDGALPAPTTPTAGEWVLGPRRLLRLLEDHLGLGPYDDEVEHLRTEQYRQALRRHLLMAPKAFYRASFEADGLATAAELLARRDELLAAGWDFQADASTPDRLRRLAELEAYFTQQALPDGPPLTLSPGLADRIRAIIGALPTRRQPLQTLILQEPIDALPPTYRRLLHGLAAAGITIRQTPAPPPPRSDTDLGRWQRMLLAGRQSEQAPVLQGDGSLLLLRARRETHIAAYLARLLRDNPRFRPSLLLPAGKSTLDNALVQEGLPSFGIPSSSLARPTLQVLKLVPVFLWDPIDPYKIMEFVSLGVKPLDEGLANRIAAFLAQTPGLYSDNWFAMINGYMDELAYKARRDGSIQPDAVRRQYEFWFRRNRVDAATGSVPTATVREIYEYLHRWAADRHDRDEQHPPSLLVLAAQARRTVELLNTLTDTDLNYLELERIVRTIYEPAPAQVQEAEAERPPYVYQPAAVTGPIGELVWYDFVEAEPDYFFSAWYPRESAYLQDRGIELESPQEQNARLVAQRKRPILYCQNRLILCLPDYVDGAPVNPYPLFGDLQAAFRDLAPITLSIDEQVGEQYWQPHFQLPVFQTIQGTQWGRPRPFVRVNRAEALTPRTAETPSSLEDLFYYPHQWVLRHKIRLRPSSILSVVDDHALMGNLAHRFIERLLEAYQADWDRYAVERWLEEEAGELLSKEGATLLLYGREPEMVAFLKRMKYAAWSLVNLIRENGWQVKGAEHTLEGQFCGVDVRGRADLVLTKDGETAVVDLKWRGATHYQNVLRNEEDLQLALYARLLSEQPNDWAHTAYFIMESGRMFTRNEAAFQGAYAVNADADHRDVYRRLFERMEATYHWRLAQLARGQVEIRCKETHEDLEEQYGAELLPLLEMKSNDARYDAYRTLIGLVDQD